MKKTTSVISIFLVLLAVFSLLVLMLNLKNGGTKVEDNDKPPGTVTLPSTDSTDPSLDLDETNIEGTWIGKEEAAYWTMENGWNDFGWQEENFRGAIYNTNDNLSLDGASFDKISLEPDVPYMHFYFEGSELGHLTPTGSDVFNGVVLYVFDEANETASDGFKQWLITNFERQVEN